MVEKKFLVIIANYNGAAYLPVCLSSIFNGKYNNFGVVVVDDASTDESRSIVKRFAKLHNNLRLLVNEKNLGPSGSRNRALKNIKADYVIFLDNDTEVDKNWLKGLLEVYEKYPKTGAVQCKLFDFDERGRLQNAGLKLIPQVGWALGIGQNSLKPGNFNKPHEIIGLSAALSVKREVFEKGINFDNTLFHYSEDLDFSWRIWIAGYEIRLAPDSIVYHKVKKISERKNVGASNEIVYFHLCKNSLKMLTKNYEFVSLLKYLPQALVINISRAVLVLVMRADLSALKGTLKALFWYMENFATTIKERRNVQNMRLYSDKYLFPRIMLKDSLIDIYKKNFRQTKLLPL